MPARKKRYLTPIEHDANAVQQVVPIQDRRELVVLWYAHSCSSSHLFTWLTTVHLPSVIVDSLVHGCRIDLLVPRATHVNSTRSRTLADPTPHKLSNPTAISALGNTIGFTVVVSQYGRRAVFCEFPFLSMIERAV
jgi:hypothetical protein